MPLCPVRSFFISTLCQPFVTRSLHVLHLSPTLFTATFSICTFTFLAVVFHFKEKIRYINLGILKTQQNGTFFFFCPHLCACTSLPFLPPPFLLSSLVCLSLLYCWTIILVQTVKCIILYNFIEEKTFRRSLCLDHDCTCKNELICKLCFTALYSWTGLSHLVRASSPLPLGRVVVGWRGTGNGHRIGRRPFVCCLVSILFPHLFVRWFICFVLTLLWFIW